MVSILVVDDSNYARTIISNIIKNKGWNIFEASNGKEALDKIANQVLDCIILDLTMPEMDGRTVLKQLQEQNTNIPVIVVTADVQDSTRQEVMHLGVKKVINKPVKKENLIESILESIS
ncbi:MAG: response regulator [Promethearchaeota archaeon]